MSRCAGLAALLGLALVGCAAPSGPCGVPLAGAHGLQRSSLAYAHYADGDPPAEPSDAERSALAARLAAADAAEADALRACYGDETDLLVHATRDSDGDGIHDYRVSTEFGKLHEGDLDLDGDGVPNVHDAAPHDPATRASDANGNGVPDRVDWRLAGRDAEAAERQEALAEHHAILLLERSAEFDAALARAAHDVLTRIYRVPLASGPGLSALAAIATEEVCLLAEEVDDGTHGIYVPQTRALTIYRAGLDAPPLVQLGLLVHELGHAYQYSLDYDASDPTAENTRIHHAGPNFLAEVAPFGWSAEPLPPDETPGRPVLYTDHYFGVEPLYRYRGRTPDAWLEWLDDRYAVDGDDYLRSEEVAGRGILGEYSLESPWEWHSDHLIAYVFVELEAEIARDPALAPRREDLVASMRAASREVWPGFRYANLAPEVRGHFRHHFPIRDEDLAYLVRAYVVAPAAGR